MQRTGSGARTGHLIKRSFASDLLICKNSPSTEGHTYFHTLCEKAQKRM
jgi:hypothetical protein